MTWNRAERDFRRLGDWSFERRDDEIAALRWRGRRVLRSVRAVIRDHDWNTVPLLVDSVVADGDVLELAVRSDEPAAFIGSVRVELVDGGITIGMDLQAAQSFLTNRIGLVVLHPPLIAGQEVVVGRADGTTEHSRFPLRISPHQPMTEISELEWSDEDTLISVRFDGDVFEMEDQRNWTDASYKTYNRPLSLPFPYSVAAGEHITQSVHITAQADTDSHDAEPCDAVIRLSGGGRFPSIGVAASSAPDPAPAFAPLGPELLVELDLASTNWHAALERAAATGQHLDVRLVLDPEAPDEVARAVAALDGRPVVRIAAFHAVGDARHVSDAASTALLRSALASAGREIPVVGGSRSHFTEMNREFHRLPDDLDGLVVTLTPLFHSRDTEQLVESIAIQRLIADEMIERAAGLPVHIGPVALAPRFNDVATGPQPAPSRIDLAEGYGAQFTGVDDPRQRAAELAAWVIASAAALARPGVATVVWFEEWGPRGVRNTDGTDLPVLAAVRELLDLAADDTAELISGPSPDGFVWALGSRTPEGGAILAANIDTAERSVRLVVEDETIALILPPASFTRIQLPAEEQHE